MPTDNTPATPRSLSPPQIARRWTPCTPEQVIRLITCGALAGFSVSLPGAKKKRWRVTMREIERYERGEPVPAPTPAPRRRRKKQDSPTYF
jgi:hypothetical protein